MAKIIVSDLNHTGFNLFTDSESFLDDISEENLDKTFGGGTPFAVAVGFVLGAAIVDGIYKHYQ